MTNRIVRYFHCKRCIAELPEGKSPADHSHLAVGLTADGVQVWCLRHDQNVVDIELVPAKMDMH